MPLPGMPPTALTSPIALPTHTRLRGTSPSPVSRPSSPGFGPSSPSSITSPSHIRSSSSPVHTHTHNHAHSHLNSPIKDTLRPSPIRTTSASPSRGKEGELRRGMCPTCGKAMEPSLSPSSPRGKASVINLGDGEEGESRGRVTLKDTGTSPIVKSEGFAPGLLPAFDAPKPSPTAAGATLTSIPELKSPTSPASTSSPAPPPSALAPLPVSVLSTPTKRRPSAHLPMVDPKIRAQEWGKLRALAMSISLGREPISGVGSGVSTVVGSTGTSRAATPPGAGRIPREVAAAGAAAGGAHPTVVEALKRQEREDSPVMASAASPTSSPTIPAPASPNPNANATTSSSSPVIPNSAVSTSTSASSVVPNVRVTSPRSSSVPGSPRTTSPRAGSPIGGVSRVRERAGSNASLRERGESETVEVLRKALLKVLDDAEELMSRHDTLMTSQLELSNELKIARSNLVMAEMNAEMLEEALKRGVGGESFGYTRHGKTPSVAGVPGVQHSVQSRPGTPGAGERPSTESARSVSGGAAPPLVRRRSGSEASPSSSPIVAPTPRRSGTINGTAPAPPPASRPSLERSNTMSGTGQGSTGGSVGGLLRRSMEKTRKEIQQNLGPLKLAMPDSFSDFAQVIPLASPSTAARNEFFSQFGASKVEAAIGGGGSAQNSAGPRSAGTAPGNRPAMDMGPSVAEMQKLRANFVHSQTTVKSLTGELDIMKKAKESLEAELETLSQALFEEANKMVAEERKKRAEMEEEAREAMEERDAIKRAMQLMDSVSRQGTPLTGVDPMAIGEGEMEKGEPKKKKKSLDVVEGKAVDEVPTSETTTTEPAVEKAEEAAPEAPVPAAEPSGDELEALLKRMEEDFGKL